MYEELKDQGFELIAAAQDTAGEAAAGKFYDRAKATFTTLIDKQHTVSTLYGMVNVPMGVWIDEEGHMGAAATMIFKSGAKNLVRKVGRTNNFIRLGEVTEGPVMDWILTSGLTQTEVATIQEPFMGRPEPEPQEPVITVAQWRTQEDARLKARYAEVLDILAADPDASIEAAIDTLAARPDLVAKLLQKA